MKRLLGFCILFCLVIVSFGLPYGKESGVINLTKKNFSQTVFGNEKVWLVEFYAPWCGHCKKLAPEWEKLAKDFQGIIGVAAINCDEEKELAGAFGIQGFPTIKLFPSKPTKTKDGKGYEKIPEDYNGARTASALANFAVSKIPSSFVKELTSKNADEFLNNQENPKVLLFTDKDKTSPLYKSLSADFHTALDFSEIRNSQKDLVARYNIDTFPTLLVITPEGETKKYSGKLQHATISSFLMQFVKSQPDQEQQTQTPPPPPEPTYDVRAEVLTEEAFNIACGGNKACFITFLDPTNTDGEEHKKYVDLIAKLHEKHKKVVNFIWMDGLKQTDFVDTFHLYSGFPSSLLFQQKKMVTVPYVGAFSEEAVDGFVDRLGSGFKKAVKLDKIPKVLSAPKDEL